MKSIMRMRKAEDKKRFAPALSTRRPAEWTTRGQSAGRMNGGYWFGKREGEIVNRQREVKTLSGLRLLIKRCCNAVAQAETLRSRPR
jgi:hypothetical protein